MSIAAEHVADRQRLRERLRAVSLETTLAVSGLVAIVVRVLDDNFIQPQPRTSPLDYRVSGPVPAAGAFPQPPRNPPQAGRPRRWHSSDPTV